MAAAKERGYREYREPNEHTRLKWRVGSSTTTKRQRRQFGHRLRRQLRNQEQSSAHTSELQERSSMGEEATEH